MSSDSGLGARESQRPLVRIDRDSTALLIVDMQNDFAHPDGYFGIVSGQMREMLDCDPTHVQDSVGSVRSLLLAARAAHLYIVHTRMIREPDAFNSIRRLHSVVPDTYVVVPEPGNDTPPPLRPDSWGAQIVDCLAAQPGEYVLVKRSFSAFYGTDLEIVLRRRGIRTLLLAGTLAHACILHTAFDAHVRDFDVLVAKEATSSWARGLRTSVVRIVDLIIGHSVSLETLIQALGGEGTQ